MIYILYSSTFLLSLLISLVLTSLARRLALKWKVFDHPGGRKVHDQPKPILGGIAIFISFCGIVLATAALALPMMGFVPEVLGEILKKIPEAKIKLWTLFVGGSLVFGLGFVDDLRGRCSLRIKVLIQSIAAAIAFMGGIRIELFGINALGFIVTVIWIVGITNAFNLLDNMDGVSAGIAAIVSVLLSIIAIEQQQVFIAVIFLALSGALLGFLRYNFYPAKIFMGDAGSLFIGYLIGTLTVAASYRTFHHTHFIPVLAPIILLGVPIFDMLFVIYIRLRTGKPIYIGDNNHLTHRLMALGLSYRGTVAFMYLITFCVGAGAICIIDVTVTKAFIIMGQAVLFFMLIMLLMDTARRLHDSPSWEFLFNQRRRGNVDSLPHGKIDNKKVDSQGDMS